MRAHCIWCHCCLAERIIKLIFIDWKKCVHTFNTHLRRLNTVFPQSVVFIEDWHRSNMGKTFFSFLWWSWKCGINSLPLQSRESFRGTQQNAVHVDLLRILRPTAVLPNFSQTRNWIRKGKEFCFKGAVSWIVVKIWKAKETCLPMANKIINGQIFFKTAILGHRNHSNCFWLRIANIKLNAHLITSGGRFQVPVLPLHLR